MTIILVQKNTQKSEKKNRQNTLEIGKEETCLRKRIRQIAWKFSDKTDVVIWRISLLQVKSGEKETPKKPEISNQEEFEEENRHNSNLNLAPNS